MSTTGHAIHQLVGKRQVHLDFHTSEHLFDIGNKFSKEQFQSTLKLAHVDAVNLFAKCHHSWFYYPTKAGNIHPNLNFDLLGSQIEACKEIGVKVQIYFTFGWSANDAESHPEWCVRDLDGKIVTNANLEEKSKSSDPLPNYYWKFLCPNTGYHELVMSQVRDLCQRYSPDGFWFDIYQVHRHCFCESCLRDMKNAQIDCLDANAIEVFYAEKMSDHCESVCELITSYHPEANVFFNGTTAIDSSANFRQEMFKNNSIQDLEDLPTVWGGYDKLPIQSKYFLQSGYKIAAMSGKFHTAWGEFGGFKHADAIRYEAASMIAWGAACNFGDQLHPSGLMDSATYANIGIAYAYVKKIEEYGIGGLPVSRIGLWRTFSAIHDEGMAKILLENQINFEIANFSEDLSRYSVVIVPGSTCLKNDDARKLNAFADSGGHLIVLGGGALSCCNDAPIINIGAEFLGESNFDCDYISVKEDLSKNLVNSPFLNFKSTRRFKPHSGTEILAKIYDPYFSRTGEHYCSHQNTPYRIEELAHPAIIRNGTIIYIAPELDWMYMKHGARLHRDLFINVLRLVKIVPMIKTSMPSAGRLAFLSQAQKHRYVAHLLYAPPMQRGNCEVIEDMPPLYDVPLRFNLPEKIISARLLPDKITLPISWNGNEGSLIIPSFSCHCAVSLDYV